jgi:arginase
VLRERGLISRLHAVDLGDVVAPAYRDYARPAHGPRNEALLAAYSRLLSERVSAAVGNGQFGVVLGGDCSIALACLLAARRKVGDTLGLVYLDAHADFADGDESRTASASSMTLALATGRGDTPLARLAGSMSLVSERRTAVVGRRESPPPAGLAASSILDLPSAELLHEDWLEMAALTLDHVVGADGRGFWIQLDVDVIDPLTMTAVDSPEPNGLTPAALIRLVTPLVRHPKALGLSVTTYDPALDPDRSCARQLVTMLEALLVPDVAH